LRYSGEQRLLILDVWRRSALPAADFAPLVGVSMPSLYKWKKVFEAEGPAGLLEAPRRHPRQSALPEVTRRSILMLKESNPDWGVQRISDMLARGPALKAGPAAIARVLKESGYEFEEEPTLPHPEPRVTRFERGRPNELWQTDLFTFVLKRQNRRVYLVAFLDDHSRFVVSYGLHASQSTALVLEVFRAGIASYGAPQEVLTDNGSQYVTWRGKSAFAKECDQRGIKHIVARPRHPQTLGKTERFWGTMWRECLATATFLDMADAQRRIGLFIDWYNLQRPHQALDGLVPADRFFEAAPAVKKAIQDRMAANALDIARNGEPKEPFYVVGQVGGQAFSVNAEGDRVFLRDEGGARREIDLVRSEPTPAEPAAVDGSPVPRAEQEPEEEARPGTSPLDRLRALWRGGTP
jgi:transposase InsO family protein